MIVLMICFVLAGTALLICGLLVWKKDKIDLIHSYHHTNVKEKDRTAYCQSMGKTFTAMGSLICIAGLSALIPGISAAIPVVVFFAVMVGSLFALYRIEKKFNGEIFG